VDDKNSMGRTRRFRSRGGRRALALAFGLFAGAFVLVTALWAAGAIYYAPIAHEWLRAALAAAWILSTLLAFALLRARGRTFVAYLIALTALIAVWFQIPASNDRDWQPEMARTPSVTIAGDTVTVHNIRNFNYRTETDFDPSWETRTYDLRQLDSADLIAVYWAGKAIAHIMLSFGFGGKDYLAVSIETRKEKGETYSTLAGFFRQYEIYYVVADERDVVRVRTNYRTPPEDVYLYRIHGPVENLRRVFLDYMKSIKELHERPQFYNTLITNCTTSIWLHTRMNRESPPLSWKILLSGYLPDYLYELGRLDSSMPFADLETRSLVNARAHAADKDPAFSRRIREGLPSVAFRP
jgi:hypothetical protein